VFVSQASTIEEDSPSLLLLLNQHVADGLFSTQVLVPQTLFLLDTTENVLHSEVFGARVLLSKDFHKLFTEPVASN